MVAQEAFSGLEPPSLWFLKLWSSYELPWELDSVSLFYMLPTHLVDRDECINKTRGVVKISGSRLQISLRV